MSVMTKGEREDLQRLIRQREKAQIAAARSRSADLLADFENQMASEFSFDEDAVWAEAAKEADHEVERANRRIAARCQELGIPKQFAPSLHLSWHHRGYGNSVKERREELRRVARAQVEALERQAIVQIQQASVEAQTELALAGLTSEAARLFVSRLPTVENLMPALSYRELAGEAEPPIVEQLATPNALRQRRYRERQKALRGGGVTPALPDGSGEGEPL
jgi:hypothetical protein